MSLQLVLGSSGAGKSHKIYSTIINDSIENPKQKYIIIVPEQFTLQTQKNMVNMHPNNGILNIDVLSFVRLAYKIFEELGKNPGVVLDDTGKNMILRKIVGMEEDKLMLFKGNIKKQGFISEIKSLISELCQYSVTPEDLLKIENDIEDGALKIKLQETHTVYEAFKKYLEERYITAEEVLDKLYDVLEKSEIIRDAVICFDGFTGFTPIQYRLLIKLMKLCKKVLVTVTIAPKEAIKNQKNIEQGIELGEDYTLFGMSKKTIHKIKGIAKENGITIDEDMIVRDFIEREDKDVDEGTYNDNNKSNNNNNISDTKKEYVGRFKNSPALSHIEQNIFRYPHEIYSAKQDDIEILALEDADKEVEYVVRHIRKLVREEGLRYREIAVVTGDIANYGRLFEEKLTVNNIPYFIDNKKSVMDNPFVEMIRALFEIYIQNYSYESIFRYLRTGMTDYSNEDIDILENYVLAFGKKGIKQWGREWKAKDSFYREEVLEYVNDLRKSIYALVSGFTKKLKDNMSVIELSIALYNYIVENKSFEKIKEYKEFFVENDMLTKAKEYEQVYKIVMDLLDKMVGLLGEEQVTIREYLEIFEAGIEDVKIGVIPMTIDQLVVGDIERTRLNDIKVLFFVGCNENVIPKSKSSGGIISELDRELLASKGVELAPNPKEALFIEQFYLYMNLTKASDKLVISFARIDAEGKAINPSYFVGKLSEIIDGLKIRDEQLLPTTFLKNNMECLDNSIENIDSNKNVMESDILDKSTLDNDKILQYENKIIEDEIDKIIGNNHGLDYFAKGLRNKNIENMSDEWKQLLVWFGHNREYEDILKKMVNEAYYTNNDKFIKRTVAELIYKNADKSVTEIEKYASCAYAHFLRYGLKLRERKTYEIELPDIGTIFHNTLDMFSKELIIQGKNWRDIDEIEQGNITDKCVDNVVEDYGGKVLYSSKRNEYMINRIKRMARKTVWALCNHVKEGDFTPTGFEVSFTSKDNLQATNIRLDDDSYIGLRGSIDRVDTCVAENNDTYVKVIDYKSSSKDFDPSLFNEGIQLQLMVYMSVALDGQRNLHKDKNVKPAGVFYYTIDDPFIDKDEKLANSLRVVKGNFLEEKSIIDKSVLEKLTMKGIVSSNPEVIEKIDKSMVDEEGNLIAKANSKVIKLGISAKGDFKSNSNAIAEEDFDLLIGKTCDLIKEKVSDMKNGIIDKNPYKADKSCACTYCEFASVCNFDIKFEDNSYHKIYKKSLDEVIEKLKSKDEIQLDDDLTEFESIEESKED